MADRNIYDIEQYREFEIILKEVLLLSSYTDGSLDTILDAPKLPMAHISEGLKNIYAMLDSFKDDHLCDLVD